MREASQLLIGRLPSANERDPFYQALLAIEPDFVDTQWGGAAYNVERAAALLRISPLVLQAWIWKQYQFQSFSRDNQYLRIGYATEGEGTENGPISIVPRWTVFRLKKALEKEPRPFPPLVAPPRKPVKLTTWRGKRLSPSHD
jgi:hypothetical protein